ncbi:MAG: hypothetical protein QW568_02850 [Candidatus Anstonellaceae archaeon]
MKQAIIILIAALLLLFGCTGVPQEKYNTLKESCDREKAELSASAEKEQVKSSELQGRLSNCQAGSDADKLVIRTQESQIAALKADSSLLLDAKGEADKIGQLRLLRTYYEEAFGPGKIANSYKLNRIDAQTASLSDTELYNIWKSVRNCQSSTECDTAKANFIKAIDTRITAIAFRIVDIVNRKAE